MEGGSGDSFGKNVGTGRKPGRIRDEIMKTGVCRIRFEGKGC